MATANFCWGRDMTECATIDHVGHKGDGIATLADGQTAYIPYTLPGEQVSIVREGDVYRPQDIITPHPERVAPECQHYGQCGGCQLQHASAAFQAEWKSAHVKQAFAMHGFTLDPDPIISIGERTRRRAVLSAKILGKKLFLGFHAARSHRVIDIDSCQVLRPELVAALPALRALLQPLLPFKSTLKVTVILSDTGLDVSLAGYGKEPTNRQRLHLLEAAQDAGFARLSLDDEVLVAYREPLLHMGKGVVVPPPGAFLQASRESEQAMVGLVRDIIGEARMVADLFCGLGTFTLPLAEQANVYGVESYLPALRALDQAARRAHGLRPIKLERRDLFRRPMPLKILNRFDAILFDPPRAGAKEQCALLAKSSCPLLVAVSCNPGTLARDCRILVDGGYKLERVTPIDQFTHSAHVEAVAVLRRND